MYAETLFSGFTGSRDWRGGGRFVGAGGGAGVRRERVDGGEVGSTLAPDGQCGGEADGRLRTLAVG